MPENFERLLEKLGARVEIRRRFSDHHRFSRREIDRFMRRCVERDMELIVTTEKDAVRFPDPKEIDVPIYFLRIEVEILRGHEVWDRLIDRLCATKPGGDPLLRLRDAVGTCGGKSSPPTPMAAALSAPAFTNASCRPVPARP